MKPQLTTKLLVVLVIFILAAVCFIGLKKHLLLVGVYDPKGTYDLEQRIGLQAYYYAWTDPIDYLIEEISKNKSDRQLLLTIEPWPKKNDNSGTPDLLSEITDGKYDENIKNICQSFSKINNPILLRWGHEMELPGSRYPWTNKKPAEFISAYRHFYSTCKSVFNSALFVWSPAGESGLEKYWPGDEYVDFVGLSVYSYDLWDIKNVGHQRSFREVVTPKYNRIKPFNKPVLISEMGVTGSDKYKEEWFAAAASDFKSFNLLKGVIIFNSPDTEGTWGKDLPTPAWEINPSAFDPLLKISEKN